MPIEHVNIVDPEIHEPKDLAAVSTANNVYLSDGAGSGDWEHPNPHGGFYYSNIGTGTTFAAPVAYTLMNSVGITTHADGFTNNGLGRLTYTDAPTRHVHIVVDLTFKHSTGSGQDVFFVLYHNGVEETGTTVVQTADSANYQQVAFHWDESIVTDDYFEVYLKTASGNVIVHKNYMFIMGMPD